MPLLFPQVDHVPLGRPPLREVICQIRFPPILAISEKSPADFQETIRDRFPNLETEQELLVEFAADQMRRAGVRPPTFRFQDRDRIKTVSLSIDFVALSTQGYISWESFADDLRYIVDALIEVYRVQYSTRLGLRYINSLNEQNTGSSSFYPEVIDIIRPELTCLLRTDAIANPYIAINQIRVRHEEGIFSFQSGVIEEDKAPLSYVLDFDQYTEDEITLDAQELLELCDRYHALIYNAFRWSIKPEKLAIFEPAE